MIVVFGATGTIGGQVLRHLQEQGADVRAVARSREKADALGGVVADLADRATLPAAVAGADHVFVASELELHTNTELTRAVHQLTTEIHARLVASSDGSPASG